VSDQLLKGHRIVVGGGTGDVGVDIVAALLDAGADVIVPTRSSTKADALRHALRDPTQLTLLDGFPSDELGVERLMDAVGEIHGAVAVIGSWRHATALTAMPVDEWSSAIAGNLTAHFLFAKAVMPRIMDGGHYVMINGAGALAPVPQSAHVSIMASAQLMLGEALKAENPRVLFHTLMLKSIIATRARSTADPAWVTSREVGDMTAWLFGEQGRLTAGSTVTLSAKTARRPMRLPHRTQGRDRPPPGELQTSRAITP
jgi:NAD(P)-dependent dehydrogenase (short-subunit alcohol dehydrogenase family)